ncbi:MAG: hypothetical protein CM15mP98_11010 [Paracoccaceae bacterium]|nr:MAG: hypothetical protein CM15mP98_11010 [Paracoccaceae bacterium]
MPEMQTKPVNKYLLPRIKTKNSTVFSDSGLKGIQMRQGFLVG